MTPERWEHVSEVLEQALALETTQLEAYLDQACAGDSELRREVESLLASHEQAGSAFLNGPAVAADGAGESVGRAPVRSGRRIGPYLVEKEIGHGGMGEVFSAVRADGQYEKKVAIKLVRSGYDSAFVLDRFRNERQILAGLDHLNIARLLDGGTTSDSVPYLVMELVDGVPIDSYCDASKLTTTARLNLFRQVCSAVQYAHQRLVIHRDIKPGNILVTSEGVPKLLDFGIAKILDASGSAEATVLRPMTPEYASPEQIRGEPITTATDVYSLGVVLYQLLTGRSPYRVDARTSAKLAEAITNQEPERPSTSVGRTESVVRNAETCDLTPESVSSTREASPLRLQRRLRGDLDFILLKALRKEASLRYASVGEFAEDIRNHLERLPVSARKGTWSYRAGKFIRRHRAGVAAAALVLVALTAGAIVTVREARIADANRRRAEARFNDVRKLANSLIFELNDSIENIPGTTQPRKLILQRALEYLDSLAKESGNEPDLQRELAAGYLRIAGLQGDPKVMNLGDTPAALASFQKALALRESLARLNPGNRKDQIELATGYINFSDFQSYATGNLRVGMEYIQKAVVILDRERSAAPDDLQILDRSAQAYIGVGVLQTGEGMYGTVGTVSAGVDALQKGLIIAQQALQISSTDTAAQRWQAAINYHLGEAEIKLGDRSKALSYYRQAVDIFNLLNAKGNDIRIANNLTTAKQRIGDVLLMEGKTSEAIASFTEREQEARQLAATDPHSEILQRNLIAASALLGHALMEGGRIAQGASYIRQVLTLLEAHPSKTPLIRTFQAQAHAWNGEAAERSGKLNEASEEYAKGKEILAAVRAAGTNNPRMQVYFSVAADRLGAVCLKLGDVPRARKEYDDSLALLEPLVKANPDNVEVLYALAETYTGQGNVAMKFAETNGNASRKAANWAAAHTWFLKSQATWSKVPNPARISTSYLEVTLPDEVARRLAACNAQISSLASSDPSPSATKD